MVRQPLLGLGLTITTGKMGQLGPISLLSEGQGGQLKVPTHAS